MQSCNRFPTNDDFDAYVEGNDRYAVFDRVAAEMYQVAHPNH